MTFRAVIFDAGNTLLFLDYARLAPAMAVATGVPLTAAGLEAQARAAALALERSDGTDRERASRYLETLFRLAGVPEGHTDVVRETLFALHREKHLWGGLKPGTREALDRLREAGYRLAVISNSDGRAEEALVAAGLRDCFELVIDSELVGFEKPDPRIFHVALRRMGLGPADVLYVGDIYEVDVIGARRAGMDVVLLDPLDKHPSRDVRTARTLTEVVEMVLHGRSG
ncbi:MAG TPA: HAD family hydrolase [Gemmatimonadales bacterium]